MILRDEDKEGDQTVNLVDPSNPNKKGIAMKEADILEDKNSSVSSEIEYRNLQNDIELVISTLKELIDSTITNDPITPFGSLALNELGVIF